MLGKDSFFIISALIIVIFGGPVLWVFSNYSLLSVEGELLFVPSPVLYGEEPRVQRDLFWRDRGISKVINPTLPPFFDEDGLAFRGAVPIPDEEILRSGLLPSPPDFEPLNSPEERETFLEHDRQSRAISFTRPGIKIYYPFSWSVGYQDIFKDYFTFSVNNRGVVRKGAIQEIIVSEFLAAVDYGPDFMSPPPKSQESLAILSSIYEERSLSNNIKNEFLKFTNQLFGRAATHRSDITYFESENGVWRGVSYYNLSAPQDYGLYPNYQVMLYDRDGGIIIDANILIGLDTPEVLQLNLEFDKPKYQTGTMEDIYKLDESIKTEFQKLIESSERPDLSFGSDLDDFDKAIRTLTKIQN
jgi:hypothetical protein